MTPNEYRKKHKRCTTCVYCVKQSFYDNGYKDYHEKYLCEVKNKETGENSGTFCRVYKAREFKE